MKNCKNNNNFHKASNLIGGRIRQSTKIKNSGNEGYALGAEILHVSQFFFSMPF